MKIKTLVAGLTLLIGVPAGAGSTLDLQISPMMSMAPANLTLRFTVAPDAANRALEVTAESDGFFRSSELPLEGEAAPRVVFLEYRAVPSGVYHISGVLLGAGGQERAIAEKTATVN